MAIEIKELVVKFSVEKHNGFNKVNESQSLNAETLKEIVNQCKQEVLEQLSHETER